MKPGRICGTLAGFLLFCAYVPDVRAEWFILKWMEKPATNGPSSRANPEDRVEFMPLPSFDRRQFDEETWPAVRDTLQEGDVIAYWKQPWEASLELLFKAKINSIAYTLFKYGHVATVVRDSDDEKSLRLLTSYPFIGITIREDLDTLRDYSWHAYRLNQWDRVDKERFHKFISLVRRKAEKWYGYDFFGLIGLWNSNLQPNQPEQIAYRYICSTVIAAAFNYAGVELEVSPRHGFMDIVTPYQLVGSKGRIVSAPRSIEELSNKESEEQLSTETNGTGNWINAENSD